MVTRFRTQPNGSQAVDQATPSLSPCLRSAADLDIDLYCLLKTVVDMLLACTRFAQRSLLFSGLLFRRRFKAPPVALLAERISAALGAVPTL